MTLLIFIYNIFLIMIYTCTTVMFAMLFIRNRKASHLAVAVLFLFYVLDNTIVYMAEFISSFTDYYDSILADGSVYKTIILATICLCYLFIKTDFTNSRSPKVYEWVLYGFLIVWFLVIPEVKFNGNIWFYYIAEPLFQIYLCGSIFFCWLKNRGENPELANRIYAFRYLWLSTPLLAIGVMTEDALVLFNLAPIVAMNERIRRRNIFEDILSLVFVFYAIYGFLREQKAADTAASEPIEKPADTVPLPYLPLGELDITGFASEYGLTKRESQVLNLLLEDKSNHEMQEILVIAPGTVKNHIHNIYQKTNVSKRSQLLMLVSEFTMK